MDGIQPYGAAARPTLLHPTPQIAATPAKTPSDYLRAIRRRIWLVLTVLVVVAVRGTLMALRMPAIYAPPAEMIIEPPRYDPHVASLVSSGDMGRGDASSNERYVPDRLAMLRS